MHLSILSLALGVLGTPFLAAASPASTSTSTSTTVTLHIPSSPQLLNPYTLPSSTLATLSSLHKRHSAPLSTHNTFVFHNVTDGSYLVDVHCATHFFAPLRLDIVDGQPKAWETYRGNDWNNKGEGIPLTDGRGEKEMWFELRVLGAKNYFVERSKFSVFTILKNPMILLGLVSMGIFVAMPYLVDNMDPEMRAEWEERQKTNPMNSLMGAAAGGQPGAANPMGNFDVAAFLAGGSSKKDDGATADDEEEEEEELERKVIRGNRRAKKRADAVGKRQQT